MSASSLVCIAGLTFDQHVRHVSCIQRFHADRHLCIGYPLLTEIECPSLDGDIVQSKLKSEGDDGISSIASSGHRLSDIEQGSWYRELDLSRIAEIFASGYQF